MRARADLHIHSNVSDGVHSPTRIVELALMRNLGGIALTDHDTIDGLSEFLAADAGEGLLRVPGIEISSEYGGREAHIIGYFVDPYSKSLKSKLTWVEDARRVRFPKLIEKLRELGIEITDNDVDDALNGVTSPGRPHAARMLVRKGVVKDVNEAFEQFLKKGKPAYVRRDRLSAKDAVLLLKEEGAVPVLAHPLQLKVPDLRGVIIDLMNSGLAGIEVRYDYGTPREGSEEELRSIAEALGLIMTGGSDYHGDGTNNEIGTVTVPIETIDELRVAAHNPVD
ncbi:MAG: PHP domain-containing protein [Candidatus Thorarchaeota archaeon]